MPRTTRVIAVLMTAITPVTLVAAPALKDPGRNSAVAYLYAADKNSADAFKAVLDADGFRAELIESGRAGKVDFSKYGMVVIGKDTERVEWEDIAAAVAKAGRPVLGLGEGGYMFFGHRGLKLAIGSPHGAHNELTFAQAVIPVDPEKSPFWTRVGISGKTIPVFKSSGNVQIYVPKPIDRVVLLGRDQNSDNYYTIVRQDDQFVLWGYTGVPDDFTAEGRKLFLATCRYTANLARAKGKE
jgi:hypothetical protein